MAFQQPTYVRQPIPDRTQNAETLPSTSGLNRSNLEESQEWILFSPSQVESSTDRSITTRTAGLSRASDLASLNTAARSGLPTSSVLDDVTEDAELDDLDEGLHAFREPAIYHTQSHQTNGHVLPTHDGLGTFPASSAPVLEQLWQYEQFNPKRKHEGLHRRTSSLQRRLNTIDELEAQANEEKRVRIEKWRLEQSQALLEEVEKETRRQTRHRDATANVSDVLGTTPKQSDFMPMNPDEKASEPFWRRITRRFIRDVIGIDDPLLSVILGESLPGESTPRPVPTVSATKNTQQSYSQEDGIWRDRLLQRIARELGVSTHQLSPHPGAFTAYANPYADYAGMPVKAAHVKQSAPMLSKATLNDTIVSDLIPKFNPTLRDRSHAENWGVEEEPLSSSEAALDIDKERQYWEQELDVKMIFKYLRDHFSSQQGSPLEIAESSNDNSAQRTAIIRQHHPLVGRAQRSPVRTRRDSRLSQKRPSSSCASESMKSGRIASALRSGSSRNYWDIGGSVGSGSIVASGGLMGAWGEV